MATCETTGALLWEIEQMLQEIRKYREKPNCNQFVLRKKEERVERLVKIYNALEPLGNIDLWIQIASALNELKQTDQQIESIMIQVGSFGETCKVGKIKIPFQL